MTTAVSPPTEPQAANPLFDNAYLLMTLTALFWAGNMTLGKAVAGHIPPISLACLRWTFAGLLLLTLAWPHLKRDLPLVRRHWPVMLLLGITGPGLFNTLQYVGLNFTSAINGMVLQSSAPLLVALCGFALFRDRLGPLQLVGMIVSMIGVLIVISRGSLEVLTALQINAGDLWFMAGYLSWGIYTAFLRKKPQIHWLSFVTVTALIAGAGNFPGLVAEHIAGSTLQLTWITVGAVMYVAVFPSAIAYIFYNRSVELIGGNRAAVFMHVTPVFGAILAIVLLGEPLFAAQLVGFVVIIAGVVLAARARA